MLRKYNNSLIKVSPGRYKRIWDLQCLRNVSRIFPDLSVGYPIKTNMKIRVLTTS